MDPDLQQLHVYVSKDAYQRFRILVASKGMTMSGYLRMVVLREIEGLKK